MTLLDSLRYFMASNVFIGWERKKKKAKENRGGKEWKRRKERKLRGKEGKR